MKEQDIQFYASLAGLPLAIMLIAMGLNKKPDPKLFRGALAIAGLSTIAVVIVNIMGRFSEPV